MVFKRSLGEEEEGFAADKRRIISSNFSQNVTCGFSSQDLASTLEPLIRRWVRDEVQRSCQMLSQTLPRLDLHRSPINAIEIEPCQTTSLQLRFEANLPRIFFTGTNIESEDKNAVKLILFDVKSNRIVSSGPFSSLKVEIVPLDGDFSLDDEEDWSEKEFDAKVITARDGRRPLITGNLVVTLQNGVADLGEVCFTDNSSWRRSRKFMIGARVKKDTCTGSRRIREAKSQAFIVKDHRGESYKKHHPPSLDDDVWRLEKIAKDGVFHKRLASKRICTVKDFLQMYVTNESSLRKLLGGSSSKTWDTIIKHAKDCVLDDKLYIYTSGVNRTALLINSVLTVVGVTFDGQSFMPLDKLSMLQMPVVEAMKQQVYKDLNGMVPLDASSIFQVSKYEPLESVDHQVGMHVQINQDLPAFNFDDFQSIDIFYSDFGIRLSSNGSPRARWCKIRAALKWGSVRRDVAAKKMADSFSYLDFLV